MASPSNTTKSARVRERYFAGVPVFEPKAGRFSPLPWVLRKAQWLFQVREWQLLTYCVMRAGPDAVCWQTDRETAYDLDITPKKLPPYYRSLEEKGFLRTIEAEGRRYVCVVDPIAALKNLVKANKIPVARLAALNDDLELMGLPLLETAPSAIGHGDDRATPQEISQ